MKVALDIAETPAQGDADMADAPSESGGVENEGSRRWRHRNMI